MKMKTNKIILLVITLLFGCSFTGFGQDKLAQTGMKFLQLSTDAKVAAMGDAVTALESNASAVFFNPAGMARMNGLASATFGMIKYIADIKYNYASVAVSPFDGDYGVLGFFAEFVDYGDFQGTIRASNDQGYIDIGTFKPKAYVYGVSYAKALSEKFSVGGTIKQAVQDLATSFVSYDFTTGTGTARGYKPNALVYDFGMLYHTGFQSLDFGVSVRNFSKELKLEQEGYQLPLMFQVGVAYNASDFFNLNKEEHSLQLAIDANHPRDYKEQILIGGEYKFMNMLALRMGYSAPNDEHNLTAGIGFNWKNDYFNVEFDYCHTPWTVFNDVHRFSFHFTY